MELHQPGALDHFFEACETDDRVVLADMGAGASTATYEWFEKMFEDAQQMKMRFTAVGASRSRLHTSAREFASPKSVPNPSRPASFHSRAQKFGAEKVNLEQQKWVDNGSLAIGTLTDPYFITA